MSSGNQPGNLDTAAIREAPEDVREECQGGTQTLGRTDRRIGYRLPFVGGSGEARAFRSFNFRRGVRVGAEKGRIPKRKSALTSTRGKAADVGQ